MQVASQSLLSPPSLPATPIPTRDSPSLPLRAEEGAPSLGLLSGPIRHLLLFSLWRSPEFSLTLQSHREEELDKFTRLELINWAIKSFMRFIYIQCHRLLRNGASALIKSEEAGALLARKFACAALARLPEVA